MVSWKTETGKLFLIPSTIAEGTVENTIPLFNIKIMQGLRHFIVENDRSARRFLREAGIKTSFDDIKLVNLNEHTPASEIWGLLNSCREGNDTGLLSEAGLPCIADPGSELVLYARNEGIEVIPLCGPSSIFLSLMASGLNGQNFVFHGYLPIDKNSLEKNIREIDKKARFENQTQIFIETPYRNQKLFDSIINVCHKDTLLSIAVSITSENAWQDTFTIADWKNVKPELNKKNAVFLIGKNRI